MWPAAMKFIVTKESVYIRKGFNSQGTILSTNMVAVLFSVGAYQHGGRDVV